MSSDVESAESSTLEIGSHGFRGPRSGLNAFLRWLRLRFRWHPEAIQEACQTCGIPYASSAACLAARGYTSRIFGLKPLTIGSRGTDRVASRQAEFGCREFVFPKAVFHTHSCTES